MHNYLDTYVYMYLIGFDIDDSKITLRMERRKKNKSDRRRLSVVTVSFK